MTAGGKQGGRSKADVSARRRADIWAMHNRGNGVRQIARHLGLHPSTVSYYLRDKKTPTRRSIVGPQEDQTDDRPTPPEPKAKGSQPRRPAEAAGMND